MKRLLQLLAVLAFVLIGMGYANAQLPKRQSYKNFDKDVAENKTSIETINSHRVAYLSKRMALTISEAQIFWPLFNEYNDKVEVFRAERRKLVSHYHQFGISYTNEQAILFSKRSIELQAQVFEAKDQFMQKLLKVLSPQKIAAFFEAEDGFKQYLLRQINQGKPQ